MRLGRSCSVFITLFCLLFSTSCEKDEAPIAIPPKGYSEMARVDMGEDYEDQIFFNFGMGQSVMTSKVNSWDLAFEAGEDGYHVFMNGGKDVLLYNTHITDAASVTQAHAYTVNEWGFDSPSGMPDSTYVGDWRQSTGSSKNETYIVKLNDGSFKKFVIVSADESAYVLSYGDINSTTLHTITLSKNPSFNYLYFSFDNGGKQIFAEPDKSSWDIVFTRYRYIYYDLNNFRYIVTGILLNPYRTSALVDSTHSFNNINYNMVDPSALSNQRDVIGFDWKRYNFTTSLYETDLSKVYIVKTQRNEFWKIHFIDFYNANGLKGSPSFEFERIQ